jgi:hypothetical protein
MCLVYRYQKKYKTKLTTPQQDDRDRHHGLLPLVWHQVARKTLGLGGTDLVSILLMKEVIPRRNGTRPLFTRRSLAALKLQHDQTKRLNRRVMVRRTPYSLSIASRRSRCFVGFLRAAIVGFVGTSDSWSHFWKLCAKVNSLVDDEIGQLQRQNRRHGPTCEAFA